MKRLIILGAACAAACVCGCSSSQGSSASAGGAEASASARYAAPVNKFCPIMNEHAVPGADPTTVTYKGQTVGFCCADCIDTWEKMPDALKDKALREALAAK